MRDLYLANTSYFDSITAIQNGLMHYTSFTEAIEVAGTAYIAVENDAKIQNKSTSAKELMLSLELGLTLAGTLTIYDNTQSLMDISGGVAQDTKCYNRGYFSRDNIGPKFLLNPTVTNPGTVLVPKHSLGVGPEKPNDIGIGAVADTSHPLIILSGQKLLLKIENTDNDINTVSFGSSFTYLPPLIQKGE